MYTYVYIYMCVYVYKYVYILYIYVYIYIYVFTVNAFLAVIGDTLFSSSWEGWSANMSGGALRPNASAPVWKKLRWVRGGVRA